MHQDSLVGPVISFGLAGLFSDLFGDVATGVTPLTDRDASALLASLRAYPLLTGAAGGDPADLPAIEETMLRLSALAEDWPCGRRGHHRHAAPRRSRGGRHRGRAGRAHRAS